MITWHSTKGIGDSRKRENIFSSERGLGDNRENGYD